MIKYIFVGSLTDLYLLELSRRIPTPHDYWNLGVKVLNLPDYEISSVWTKHRPEANLAAHELLKIWCKKQTNRTEAFHTLHAALRRGQMYKLAAELKQWAEEASLVQSSSTLSSTYQFYRRLSIWEEFYGI